MKLQHSCLERLPQIALKPLPRRYFRGHGSNEKVTSAPA
jgi:hypothetical protein